jgi:hypothetical protein
MDKLFKVTTPAGIKLVMAPNKNSALAHVIDKNFHAAPVSKADLLQMIGTGAKIEHVAK